MTKPLKNIFSRTIDGCYFMSNILIVSGHTDIVNSRANKIILENLKNEFSNAEIDSLIELYPDYRFNVDLEQKKLLKADVIVLQFPFFWFSCPSIMRKWFEDVLLHGFAYGSTGKALEGKKMIVSFTTGAPLDAYQYGGMENFDISEFLPQFIQLTNFCGMKWSGYVVSGGYTFTTEENKIKEFADKHSLDLIDKIKSSNAER